MAVEYGDAIEAEQRILRNVQSLRRNLADHDLLLVLAARCDHSTSAVDDDELDWRHPGSRAYWAVAVPEQEGRMMRTDEACGEMTGVLGRRDADLVRIRVLAAQRVGAGLHVLVEELGALGFSWRDVARTGGVTLPVLHRWRQGAPISGGNAERTAMLVALSRSHEAIGSTTQRACWRLPSTPPRR